MIIHNTTFVMGENTVQEFVSFLREVYVPAVVGGKILSTPALRYVLSGEAGADSVSLALQFTAPDMAAIELYMSEAGAKNSELIVKTFGSRVVGFTTLMEDLPL